MKYNLAKPFLFLIAFILIVGLACSASSSDTPSEPAPPVVQEPANAPPAPVAEVASPVPPPVTAPEATVPPAPAAQHFFTEDFDGDLSGWEYFHFGEENADYTITTDNSRLVFDIPDESVYAYDIYSADVYDDVRLEAEVNNRGYNNNNVSLICRFDEDEGWYEFSIANNGLYWIYAFDIYGDTGYNEITNGGVSSIKTGKETNLYAIECEGRTLTLFVNGKEINSIQEKNFGFTEGMIGVSVSSFDVVPIKVEFEWIKIMEP